MTHKIAGCCTICDEPCFEVLARWDDHERHPGEPKRLGSPTEDAVRITFLLYDGTRTDLTFCGNCAADLQPDQYLEIWRKNIRSWMRELSEKPEGERNPEWFGRQFANGLLDEMGRQKWKELTNA